MIISRTPFRVSFFGGGTDYPQWFKEEKGAVLATTIDKYCYITCRYLPPFFEHKSRIIYSKMEQVKKVAEIQHPVVRETLKYLNISKGIEIHHDGDLPARTGLGSSSSFTVGLLNVLYALQGKNFGKNQLAKEAIYVERHLCRENVGCQDQILVSYGGFQLIEFQGEKAFTLREIPLEMDGVALLQKHLLLYFTGFSRLASEVAGHQLKQMSQNKAQMRDLYQMVFAAENFLRAKDMKSFGKLLNESWQIKRTLSEKISTPMIDEIYQQALQAGAWGGKLLGAGGGGFMLLFVPPQKQKAVKERLKKLLQVTFNF